MNYIDSILNKITMYRLTLYYLIFLVGAAAGLSYFNLLQYNPLDILINVLLAVIVCAASNYIFAKIFDAVTNVESVFITALILALIVPVKFPEFLAAASVLAVATKYLLAVEKRHIFNPAAVSVAAISLLSPAHTATWWVGTSSMFPFVFFGGLLLIRKIQRENMVFDFLFVFFIVSLLSSFINSQSVNSIVQTLQLSIFHSALFFFAFIMLTEPLTTPATEKLRSYYAYVVAFLYSTPQLIFLSFGLTPELALCLGNVFSYFISPNYRLILPLSRKKQLSPDTFEFAFNLSKNIKFTPGQYLEWTLPHKNIDSRGNRRYFSISSSPTEKELMITVKFYDPSSSYKKELISLNEGKKIIASSLAGDFTLPKNPSTPLVFIAGGVGIAPFRSMIRYIIDKNQSVDVVLLYTNRVKDDILYSDIFEKAKNNGVRTIYNLTNAESIPSDWQGTTGYITENLIRELIPDYTNRIFYLSGPQLMVQRFEKTLKDTGIQKNKIKTDFFPGYSEK